ncbi:MAG TPA: hypothetical protein VFM37_13850 [Pseudonocardiaceae bacterium]|nr:hypothetical protein [Pseudonocardiaceae bacterium]
MGWQDELRRLDEELASGRLSAEEYRLLRDGLLASQAGPPVRSIQREEEQASGSPFPPPFRWDATDTTQVMPKTEPDRDGELEQTQVVPGRPGEDAERTQVVPATPPGPESGMLPPNQSPGYAAAPWQQAGGPGSQAPPWVGQDLPPVSQVPAWLRQGPESFDTERSRTGKVVAVVATVLVLLLGAGAVYWYVFRTGESSPPVAASTTNPPASTSPPAPTTTTVPRPSGPFVELDGQIVVNDTYTMADATKANRPSKTEVKTLAAAGTETVAGLVTETDGIRTGIWTFKPKAGVKAQDLLDAIDKLYRSSSYQEFAGAPRGVRALYLPASPDGSTYRAHYVHDGLVVRVESYGRGAAKTVQQRFEELLGRQLDDFPAS